MANFFDFQSDTVVVYSNDSNAEFQEIKLNINSPFFKDEVKDFVRQQSQNGNPNAIYWYSPIFTLLPQSVFKMQDISSYLNLNFGAVNAEDVASFDMLHTHNAVIAYSLPKWMKELKDTYFPLVPLKHHAGQLLARTRGQHADFVAITIYESSFVLTILKNGKLIISNSFDYQNEADLIYFLLLHCQKHEMANSTRLVVYNYQSIIQINQIKESMANFSEFEVFQIEWNEKNDFYKSILCV